MNFLGQLSYVFGFYHTYLKIEDLGPGRVAQLIGTLSGYIKVVGSTPGQDTYKDQPMHASIHGTNGSLSLRSIDKILKI